MKKALLLIIILIGVACSNSPTMPKFEEVETKVYDVGAKSQITRHVVLQDSTINNEELTYLIETLVKASENTKMKYNNGKPTHIFVYIHTTKESFDSGIYTNCLASYSKVGVKDKGKYTYRTSLSLSN